MFFLSGVSHESDSGQALLCGTHLLDAEKVESCALDADQEPSLSRIVACIDTPYLRVLRPVDRREMMGRVVLAFSTNGDFCTPSDCNNTILIWFTHDISGMLLHVCRQI